MEVINDLDLKGTLKIYQNPQNNPYTFDSVLLASFTNIRKKDKHIIDLCSGNGPVAMLLTLKKENTLIDCVEIQKKVCELAQKSINLNKLTEQIKVYNYDLKEVFDVLPKNTYDIITCNPPYFRVDSTSNINENDSVAIARHEIKVNLEDIIKISKKLLNNTGLLNLVHRPDRLDEIIVLLDKYDFKINRLQFVYPKKGKEVNTILIEAKKGKSLNNKMKILESIYVYDEDGKYTDQAKQIMMIGD